MKVYLFNDTTPVHSGCRAIMEVFDRLFDNIIAKNGVGMVDYDIDKFNEADAIVVNGEGTIHHGVKRANFLLDMLSLGQQSNKKTLLLNTLFQEVPFNYSETIKNLDLFTVREHRSFRHGIEHGGSPIITGDYCLQTKEGKKTKSLQGIILGSVLGCSPSKDIFNNNFFDKFPRYHLNDKFENVIENLKTCDCYITGSHHGIYAAGLAGIPFIPLPSNSWKIESLIESSKLNIKVCYSKKEIIKSLENIDKKVYLEFKNYLLSLKQTQRNIHNDL